MDYSKHISTTQTPQNEPIPGREKEQELGRGGGYVFTVSPWVQAERFLILGCEGPTYYASEKEMTKDNAKAVMACAKEDGRKLLSMIAAALNGRAAKLDAPLFALACLAKTGTPEVRAFVNTTVPSLLRTASQLFRFVGFLKAFGGRGTGTRRAIEGWYRFRKPADLAYQMAKYQGRYGYTHRDLLRICRPALKGWDPEQEMLIRWALGPVRGKEPKRVREIVPLETEAFRVIRGMKLAHEAKTPADVVKIVQDFRLTREMIPTEMLGTKEVLTALLPEMPLQAMLRSLVQMASKGVLAPFSDEVELVATKLQDQTALRKARIHPIQVLSALAVYQQGHGVKGNLTWDVNSRVIQILSEVFWKTFQLVQPTGKRHYLAIDVSASMERGTILGVPGLKPCTAAAVMATLTAMVEPKTYMAGFCKVMRKMSIAPTTSVETLLKPQSVSGFGPTDCALPMKDALEKQIPVDVFVVYTDNETNIGQIHVAQALEVYRQKTGIPAKLIVCAFTSTGYSIADPKDPGMLDVVGFDSAAPQVMRDFIVPREPLGALVPTAETPPAESAETPED